MSRLLPGSDGRVDSRRAAALLLEKPHIVTIPGVVFGAEGEGHLRFSYAAPNGVIEAGLAALRTLLG